MYQANNSRFARLMSWFTFLKGILLSVLLFSDKRPTTMVSFYVEKMTLNDNTEVRLSPNSLVILIGANSSGKSTLLREIFELLLRETTSFDSRKIVDRLDYIQTGSSNDWIKWLGDNFQTVEGQNRKFKAVDGEISEAEVQAGFSADDKVSSYTLTSNYQKLARFLIRSLDAENRLKLSRPVSRIDPLKDKITHEFHMLQYDKEKLGNINKEIRRAFDTTLMLDPGGRDVGGYVGEPVSWTHEEDTGSITYRKNLLSTTTPLEKDGDGIRSFVGCLLALKCSPYKVFLLDEPEAFLHPPQAKKLGKLLADTANQEERQIIVATHSSDIIKGALDSTGEVQICRVERIGNINYIHMLNNEELRRLWNKPLLKSTDAIQGAFHRGVVVCEADADCRFYEALLEKLDGNESADLHFVHGGSKGELSTLAMSYRHLHVPVAVIADFDMLQNQGELRKLVNSVGGNFAALESLYKQVLTKLNQLDPSKDKITAAQALQALLEDINSGGKVSTNKIENLTDTLTDARDWSKPKQFGLDALTGPPRVQCEKLLDELRNLGIFLVPLGEMEGWDRNISAKKSEWILKALEKIGNDDLSFHKAREFVRDMVGFVGRK